MYVSKLFESSGYIYLDDFDHDKRLQLREFLLVEPRVCQTHCDGCAAMTVLCVEYDVKPWARDALFAIVCNDSRLSETAVILHEMRLRRVFTTADVAVIFICLWNIRL